MRSARSTSRPTRAIRSSSAAQFAGAFRDAPEVWKVIQYMGSADFANARQQAQAKRTGGGNSGFLTGNTQGRPEQLERAGAGLPEGAADRQPGGVRRLRPDAGRRRLGQLLERGHVVRERRRGCQDGSPEHRGLLAELIAVSTNGVKRRCRWSSRRRSPAPSGFHVMSLPNDLHRGVQHGHRRGHRRCRSGPGAQPAAPVPVRRRSRGARSSRSATCSGCSCSVALAAFLLYYVGPRHIAQTTLKVVFAVALTIALWVGANLLFDQAYEHWTRFNTILGFTLGFPRLLHRRGQRLCSTRSRTTTSACRARGCSTRSPAGTPVTQLQRPAVGADRWGARSGW